MDHFSVKYQGMAETIQKEQKLSERLGDLASRLMACNAKAVLIGSLRDKGYPGKMYQLSSKVGSRQIDVYRMSQGLMKACDAYRSYELQVLQQAEDIVTAKNGFSKKTAKQVKNKVNSYEKQVEKNRFVEEKTFSSVLYEGTVGQWIENWKNCKVAVSSGDALVGDLINYASENYLGKLKEMGVPDPILEEMEFGLKRINDFVDTSSDLILGIVDITNPEARKNGILAFISEMTGGTDLEGIDKFAEEWMDTMAPGSESREAYDAMMKQVSISFDNGHYLEAASIFVTRRAQIFNQQVSETVENTIGGWADDFVKDVSKEITGEEMTLVDAMNGGESLLNDFAEWLNGMRR